MNMAEPEPKIRLASPSSSVASLPAIRDILQSGRLTQGVYREKFERALCEYFQVSYAVTTNSGTSALLAMLRGLGVGPGHKVALPDYGFAATAGAVEVLGAMPIFLDVNNDNFSIPQNSLDWAATKKPDFVIAVHQFGLPCDFASLQRWAKEINAVLAEDSACALGTMTDGEPLGCSGLAAILSFHPRKIVTTGEGGAVLTNDEKLAEFVRAYGEHGFSVSDKRLLFPGMNYRLPEISSAVGLEQMERIESIIAARVRVGAKYRERLRPHDAYFLPQASPDTIWNHQTFFIALTGGAKRAKIIAAMRQAGIECNVPARSISSLDYYKKQCAVSDEQVPNSRRWDKCAIGLPCHEFLSEDDIEKVCVALLENL